MYEDYDDDEPDPREQQRGNRRRNRRVQPNNDGVGGLLDEHMDADEVEERLDDGGREARDEAERTEFEAQRKELEAKLESQRNGFEAQRKVLEAKMESQHKDFDAKLEEQARRDKVTALQLRLEVLSDSNLLEDEELSTIEDKVADAIGLAGVEDGADSAWDCVMQMIRLSECIASE